MFGASCQSCSAILNVKDDAAKGRRVRCPRCGEVTRLDSLVDGPAPDDLGLAASREPEPGHRGIFGVELPSGGAVFPLLMQSAASTGNSNPSPSLRAVPRPRIKIEP